MIEFKPVYPEHTEQLSRYIKDEKINEYGITPGYAYSGADNLHYCIKDDCLITKFFDSGNYYYCLSGKVNKFPKLISELKEQEGTVLLSNLTKEKCEFLQSIFKKAKIYYTGKEQADYLYEIENFLNLSGKKARHKRENYNKFINNYDFVYKELTKENFRDCFSVLTKWCKTKKCIYCEYACEHAVLTYIYEHYEKLPVKGGIIYENNMPIAFFIGEVVGDCLMGYHQKTLHGYTGIGYAIYIEAIKNSFADCRYFNLGPDLGIKGLRQFKRQFKPYELVDKYIMEI